MGSLLKTPVVVVGFLLLLPALVYGDRYVQLSLYQDKNCTEENGIPSFGTSYQDLSQTPNATFTASLNDSYTFESAMLNVATGDVHYLVACQAGLLCNDTGAFQIWFNVNDSGAGVCSTAGPVGTKFDKFELSS